MERLGKITDCYIGLGGYQGAMFGFHVSIGGKGWGVGDSIATWDPASMPRSEHAKWTEGDRSKELDRMARAVSRFLEEAKVKKVQDLIGKPVEIEWDGEDGWGSSMKSWRILTEVL